MPQNAPWEYDPVVQPQSGGGGGAAWEGDPVVTPGVSEWRTFLDRQNRARNPGRTQQPGYSEMLDRMAMAYAQSGETPPRTGRMESFARGVSDTFSLGMDDELAGSVAGLRARVTGDDPERAAERARSSVRADRQVAREDNPATFFAGQATGGAQLAASGAGAVRAAAPGLARAAASRPLASGAGIGLVEGGGYGFGSAEGGAGERLDDAAVGAGIGTVAGVALPAAGQVTVNTMRGGRQLAREGIDAARTARQEVPAIDDLLDTTRQAYQAVDEAGVQYSARTTQRLLRDIRREAEDMRLNDRLHPRAQTVIDDVLSEDLATPKTLTELDQLRQYVRRELASSSEGGEREAGRRIIEQIDAMIESAVPEGRVENAGQLIRTARRASRTQRAAEALEDAIESALDRSGSTGTGGNEQNAIRQNLRRLITNEKTKRLFTQEQTDLIRRAVRGDGIQNTLRILSGLSPDRGLINLLGGGGAGFMLGGGPGAIILPAVGYGARQLAEGRQDALVNSIRRSVRAGNAPTE